MGIRSWEQAEEIHVTWPACLTLDDRDPLLDIGGYDLAFCQARDTFS